jgi:ABC-type dipeptide/oligopeptide/nickel transport system permease component
VLIMQRMPRHAGGHRRVADPGHADRAAGGRAGRRPGPIRWFDRIASTLAFIGFSLPTFFTGLVLILVFSIHLDWLPFVYRADIAETGWAWWWEHIKQSRSCR